MYIFYTCIYSYTGYELYIFYKLCKTEILYTNLYILNILYICIIIYAYLILLNIYT